MQLGCTKKLQDYIKRDISPADPQADPFFSWSADLLTFNRRKVISVVNDGTRSGFVLYGVTAKTVPVLEREILDGIRATLAEAEVAPELIQRYLEDCGGTITFTKTRDRSTVARMNQFNTRLRYLADRFLSGTLLQTHCLRRLNDDCIAVRGEYDMIHNLLGRAFTEHYGAARVFRHHTLTLQVNLRLDIPCLREVEVPAGFSLADLHRVVQRLFYWQDCHLHEFLTPEDLPLDIAFPEYAELAADGGYDEGDCAEIEECVSLQEAFARYKTLVYLYDFGDEWRHEITLKGENTDAEPGPPRCIAAVGTPPPEDSGGALGFAETRRSLSDPGDEEYKSMKNRVDGMGGQPLDLEQINRDLSRWFW